mmetsp:Transcript_55413/g.130783  ORF Transcript_55413/g.130783 Transcript_55413/m.130783 type:complete len:218 (-) Transcript_55413:325-978(-)
MPLSPCPLSPTQTADDPYAPSTQTVAWSSRHVQSVSPSALVVLGDSEKTIGESARNIHGILVTPRRPYSGKHVDRDVPGRPVGALVPLGSGAPVSRPAVVGRRAQGDDTPQYVDASSAEFVLPKRQFRAATCSSHLVLPPRTLPLSPLSVACVRATSIAASQWPAWGSVHGGVLSPRQVYAVQRCADTSPAPPAQWSAGSGNQHCVGLSMFCPSREA